MFKRSFDARKHSINFVYILDVRVRNEAAIWNASQEIRTFVRRPTPPTIRRAGPGCACARPVIVGFGPAACWLRCCWRRWASNPLCSSAVAQYDGAQDTWDQWRKRILTQSTCGSARWRRPVLRRETVQLSGTRIIRSQGDAGVRARRGTATSSTSASRIGIPSRQRGDAHARGNHRSEARCASSRRSSIS